MSKLYLASMRRPRIDGSEVTNAIGIFKTPEDAKRALDETIRFLEYDVVNVYNEENGFRFYFIRNNDCTGVAVCTGKITEMEVGCTYFSDDHL